MRYTYWSAKAKGKPELVGTKRTVINGRYELEDIVNHSQNIIDLIEIGDYVNGYKVSDKESTLLITNVKGIDRSGYHIPISQYGDNIKSIVTVEQYKSAEYIF